MRKVMSLFLNIFKIKREDAVDFLFISSPENKHYINKRGRSAAILCSVIIFTIVFLNFLYIEDISYADGEIIPKNKIYKLDHLWGGVVKKLFVEEGQTVNQGDFLMLLDDQKTTYELEEAIIDQAFTNLEIQYTNSLLEEKEADLNILFEEKRIERLKNYYQKNIIMSRYHKKKEEFKNKKELLNIYKSLLHKELISKATFLEYRDAIDKFSMEQMDKIYELQKFAMKNKNTISRLNEKASSMRIHSPIKGVVKNLATRQSGDVIKAGDTILEIVPINEDLIAEIKVSPENISKINIGQSVKLKISAYDTVEYGYLEGMVTHISPSTFTNESNSYYPCRVEINPNSLSILKNKSLLPGMGVRCGFFLGRITILKYLLKPIRSAFSESN